MWQGRLNLGVLQGRNTPSRYTASGRPGNPGSSKLRGRLQQLHSLWSVRAKIWYVRGAILVRHRPCIWYVRGRLYLIWHGRGALKARHGEEPYLSGIRCTFEWSTKLPGSCLHLDRLWCVRPQIWYVRGANLVRRRHWIWYVSGANLVRHRHWIWYVCGANLVRHRHWIWYVSGLPYVMWLGRGSLLARLGEVQYLSGMHCTCHGSSKSRGSLQDLHRLCIVRANIWYVRGANLVRERRGQRN